MEFGEILMILFYGVVGLVMVIAGRRLFIEEYTCSECKEMRAYEKTGSRRKSGYRNVVEYELKCKFCGHSRWMNNSSSFSGGE
jgi:hypothetical protein